VQIDQFIILSCKHSIIFITYFQARHISNASSNALLSTIKLVYFIVVPFFFVFPTLVKQSHRNYLNLGALVCILHYVSFLNNPIFIPFSSISTACTSSPLVPYPLPSSSVVCCRCVRFKCFLIIDFCAIYVQRSACPPSLLVTIQTRTTGRHIRYYTFMHS
jgi:hypothetical protein